MTLRERFGKLIVPSRWLERFMTQPQSGEQICCDCGQVGTPQRQKHGTDEIETGLWVLLVGFTILYVTTDFLHSFTWQHYHHYFPPGMVVRLFSLLTKLFLLLGPVCTIWRSSTQYQACPKCEHPTMIPLDSPRGQQVRDQHQRPPSS